MEEKKHAETMHHVKKKKFSVWKLLSLVFFVLLLASVFTYGFRGDNTQKGVISKDTAGQKALDFINSELLKGVQTATLDSVTEENAMYKVTLTLNGQQGAVYVSKDGKFLFPQAIDLDLKLPEQPTLPDQSGQVPQETQNPTQQQDNSESTSSQSTATQNQDSSTQSAPPSPPAQISGY